MSSTHPSIPVPREQDAEEPERDAGKEGQCSENPRRPELRGRKEHDSEEDGEEQERRTEQGAGDPFAVPRIRSEGHKSETPRPDIRPSLVSLADVEPSGVSFRFGPGDLGRLDPSVRLRGPVPLDARLDVRLVPFEDRLDAAVRPVPHETIKPERFRFLRALRAEVDALHAAVEDHPSPALHGSGTSTGTERTLRNRRFAIEGFRGPRLRSERVVPAR